MAAPAESAAFSAVEFVRGLSDEQKEAVFLTLAEEGVAAGPEPFAVPIARGEAPAFAYLLSAKEYNALQERYQFPHADDDYYEAKRIPREQRNWLTTEEMMEWLDQEDVEPDQEPPPPSAGGRTPADR